MTFPTMLVSTLALIFAGCATADNDPSASGKTPKIDSVNPVIQKEDWLSNTVPEKFDTITLRFAAPNVTAQTFIDTLHRQAPELSLYYACCLFHDNHIIRFSGTNVLLGNALRKFVKTLGSEFSYREPILSFTSPVTKFKHKNINDADSSSEQQ